MNALTPTICWNKSMYKNIKSVFNTSPWTVNITLIALRYTNKITLN